MRRSTKRRGNGEGGIYQSADGMWHASIELGWAGGKRRRWTAKSKSKARLLEKVAHARTELTSTGTIARKDLTLADWMPRWLTTQREYAPKTYDARARASRQIIATLGSTPLYRLTPLGVQAEVDAIAAERIETARKYLEALSLALDAAVREGLVTRNVAKHAKKPSALSEDDVEREPLTTADARALLAKTAKKRLGSMWAFVLLTGTRKGEATGLTWDRLDLEAGTADISWQLQRVRWVHGCGSPTTCRTKRGADCPARTLALPKSRKYVVLDGTLVLAGPKTKRSRRLIPLAPALVKALKAHRKATMGKPNPHNLVWTRDEDGYPLTPEDALRAWHADLSEHKIDPTPLHASRHTTATLLMELGVPDKVIAELVGHVKVTTTRGYQHVDLTATRAAVAELGDLLAG